MDEVEEKAGRRGRKPASREEGCQQDQDFSRRKDLERISSGDLGNTSYHLLLEGVVSGYQVNMAIIKTTT